MSVLNLWAIGPQCHLVLSKALHQKVKISISLKHLKHFPKSELRQLAQKYTSCFYVCLLFEVFESWGLNLTFHMLGKHYHSKQSSQLFSSLPFFEISSHQVARYVLCSIGRPQDCDPFALVP